MKRIVLILIAAAAVLFSGTSLAYYNTALLGYDNANVYKEYDGGFRLFEYDFNYEKIKSLGKRIIEMMPDETISI